MTVIEKQFRNMNAKIVTRKDSKTIFLVSYTTPVVWHHEGTQEFYYTTKSFGRTGITTKKQIKAFIWEVAKKESVVPIFVPVEQADVDNRYQEFCVD